MKWYQLVLIFFWFWLCLGILNATLFPFQYKPFKLNTHLQFIIPEYLRCHPVSSAAPPPPNDSQLTNHICFVAQQLYHTRTLYANHAPLTLTQPWHYRHPDRPHTQIVAVLSPMTVGTHLYFSQGQPTRWKSVPPNTLVLFDVVMVSPQDDIAVFGVGTKIWTWRLNWDAKMKRVMVATAEQNKHSQKKKWKIIKDSHYCLKYDRG